MAAVRFTLSREALIWFGTLVSIGLFFVAGFVQAA